MVTGSDAFRRSQAAHIVRWQQGSRWSICRGVLYPACVGMRARSCMWLWCVLPQRLNHRARAVKAPVRFPLCAWLHCR